MLNNMCLISVKYIKNGGCLAVCQWKKAMSHCATTVQVRVLKVTCPLAVPGCHRQTRVAFVFLADCSLLSRLKVTDLFRLGHFNVV